MSSEEQLKEISTQTHELVRVQYSTFNRSVLPALEKVGLHLVAEHENLNDKQAEFVDRYFEDNVYPVLTPMAMDSSRPFPLIRIGCNLLLHRGHGGQTCAEGIPAPGQLAEVNRTSIKKCRAAARHFFMGTGTRPAVPPLPGRPSRSHSPPAAGR